MNSFKKIKLNNYNSDNSKHTLIKEIKKQNKLLITIGATIGIIAITLIIIALIINEGLNDLWVLPYN